MHIRALWDSLKSRAARADFARRCDTTYFHLRNIVYYGKPCGVVLAVSIERESGGAVTRQELRPNDWASIWPELRADAAVVA